MAASSAASPFAVPISKVPRRANWSPDARGALEVSQAGNQLLALLAKQQLQLQSLTAAQYRAEAIEAARRARAQAEARAATRQFLGSGTAYTAPPPSGD